MGACRAARRPHPAARGAAAPLPGPARSILKGRCEGGRTRERGAEQRSAARGARPGVGSEQIPQCLLVDVAVVEAQDADVVGRERVAAGIVVGALVRVIVNTPVELEHLRGAARGAGLEPPRARSHVARRIARFALGVPLQLRLRSPLSLGPAPLATASQDRTGRTRERGSRAVRGGVRSARSAARAPPARSSAGSDRPSPWSCTPRNHLSG